MLHVALDSLEPVMLTSTSNSTMNNNGGNQASAATPQLGSPPAMLNPSPSNFAGSAKGMDFAQSGDVLRPRGDPQLVGLTKLTYQPGQFISQQYSPSTDNQIISIENCTADDFKSSFIEKTLGHYYEKVNAPESTSETNNALQNGAAQGINLLTVRETEGRGDSSSPERTATTKPRANTATNDVFDQRNAGGQLQLMLHGDHMGAAAQKKTGINQAIDQKKNGKKDQQDDRKDASRLLRQAKKAPQDFVKVTFSIALPYEMLLEQIQFQLPAPEHQKSVTSDKINSSPETKPASAVKANGGEASRPGMNIISNNTSAQLAASMHSATKNEQQSDFEFSSNFKILNISTAAASHEKNIGQSSDQHQQSLSSSMARNAANGKDRSKNLLNHSGREHQRIAIKSAFSERVTGKNTIEVNASAVTKHLQVTLLCLRQDVATLLRQQQQDQNQLRKKSAEQLLLNHNSSQSKKQNQKQHSAKLMTNNLNQNAERVIAEIEGFDGILDEHDNEVAFISKQHYEQEEGGGSSAVVDHEHIAMQLRGDDDEFDRDIYDEDLSNFKVGAMINNDEDDLRILDSLPQMVQPSKGPPANSFNNSMKQPLSGSISKRLDFDEHDDKEDGSGANKGPLGRFIDKIVVFGFNCNSIPAITNLTYFMNQAMYMQKCKKKQQADEIDFLVSTLMISTKRATQAGEFLRRSEANLVKQIEKNMSKLGQQDQAKQSNIVELKQWTQEIFIECAILELLIADCLSFETQLNEKLQALVRVVKYTQGQLPEKIQFAPQILVANDSFSALLTILPQLLRFCLLALTHRREIVRMSALKILKFILETQGCSLDVSMMYILKGMFLTFPKTATTQTNGPVSPREKEQTSVKIEDSPQTKSVSTLKGQELESTRRKKEDEGPQGRIRVIQDDFDLSMLIGENEAATMTASDYIFISLDPNNPLSNNFGHHNMMLAEPDSKVAYATRYAAIQEPASGFNTALQNVHSHVLETYISVLSSISSHILHRIFYDVIEDALCSTSGSIAQKPTTTSAKPSASFKQQMSYNANTEDQNDKSHSRIQMGQASQIKVYACKIAEKIITICQGDLIISPSLLSALIDTFSANKPAPPLDNSSGQAHAAMKNLWNSIKQKVFPNYSTRGYRRLIEWISSKMNHLMNSVKTHPEDLLNTKPVNQRKDAFPDELSDEETITLCQLCEVITTVTFNRLKQEEEANQLIKLPVPESFGNGASSEMYLLLPQLIFWLEYSIDREDRLQVFTQVYSTIKEVLESIPNNGRPRDGQLTIVQIVLPSLQRTNEFLQQHSPSLPMLKFLEIVLTDIQIYTHERKTKMQNTNAANNQATSASDPLKLQSFFLDMLENFVISLAYSLYEEAFSVFDKLLYLSGDAVTESAIKKCIVAFVDKYTLKSKSHKASMTTFMKMLMDVKLGRNNHTSPNISRAHHNHIRKSSPGSPEFDELMNENDLSGNVMSQQPGSYFEIMSEFCFFENVDTNYKLASKNGQLRVIDDREDHNMLALRQLDMRGPMDMHELYVDKLQFFIDSLALMTEAHIGMFTYLITNHNFKNTLLTILEHGETNIRMKAHEILEALTSYFVQCCPSKTVYEFPDEQFNKQQNREQPQPLLNNPTTKKMEAEFIAHERLYISQIVIQVAKKSLQNTNDCYLQFNALILLDFLFQNLLPVPTFQNEQVKARKQNQRAFQKSPQDSQADAELTLDIEVLSISDMTPEVDVMDPAYLRMRMKLVLSLWPHIQQALSSPWSNIRSICYGLVCSMLKINVTDYPIQNEQQHALSREIGNAAPPHPLNPISQQSNDRAGGGAPQANLSEIIADQAALSDDRGKGLGDHLLLSDILSLNVATQQRLKEVVLPMLYSLLSSKESESKAGGLNILGSFCGLSYDFSQVKINQNLAFLQRNSSFVSLPIWRLVYQLQDDWDITIKEASVVLVQLCAPRNAILYFQSLKEKRQSTKLQYLMNQMPNVQQIYVKRATGGDATEDEEKRALLMAVRPESRLKIKNFLIKRNDHAARAYMKFPSGSDIETILGKTAASAGQSQQPPKQGETSFSMQSTSMINDGFGENGGNFSDYLTGKVPILSPIPQGQNQNQVAQDQLMFSQQAVTCHMIEQEHQILADKVQAFNPDYEDTRFVKNLSRKRQLEIELDMPNRGRKQNNQTTMNFFVDAYGDEQIGEIISIFRNDFKPPKNLWIEKQPSPMSLVSGGMSQGALLSQAQQPNMRPQSPDYYQDIYAEAIEQFNQQQAQMQQMQQAQLQQQVQSGNSSTSSSASSASSNASNSSLSNATSKDGAAQSPSRESSALSAQSANSGTSADGISGAGTAGAGGGVPVTAASTENPSTVSGQAAPGTNTGQEMLGLPPIKAESAAVTQARHSPQPSGRMLDPVEDDQLRNFADLQHQKSQHGSSTSSVNSHKSGSDRRGSNSDQNNTQQLQQVSQESSDKMVVALSPIQQENKQGTNGLWSPTQDDIDIVQSQMTATQNHLSKHHASSEGTGIDIMLEASDQINYQRSHNNSGDSNNDDEQIHQQNQPLIYELHPKKKSNKLQLVAAPLKIEQLDFGNIQICGQQQMQQQQQQQLIPPPTIALQQQNQAPVRKVKPAKLLQAYQPILPPQQQILPSAQQKQQNGGGVGHPRIEFYQDPAELVDEEYGIEMDDLGDDQMQQKSTSRLGQRSSRMQLQEELQRKQNADDEAKFIIPQKLYNQLKSPTDKIQKPAFKAFQQDQSQPFQQQLPNERKSSESRKRKRQSQQSLVGDKSSATGSAIGGTKNKSTSFSKGKPNHLKLVENDYFSSEDKHVSHLRNLTQKVQHHYPGGLGPWQWPNSSTGKGNMHGAGQHTTRHRAKSIGNPSSISTPDFSQLQNKLGNKYNQNSGGGGPSQDGGVGEASAPSQELLDQSKIQRKMAQTYLSGLSKGYIQNMDNLKLINTCLHQDQPVINNNASPHNSGGPNKPSAKHPANKSFENLRPPKHLRNQGLLELQNPMKSFQTKKGGAVGKNAGSTLSTSPKRTSARDGSNSAGNNYQRKASNHGPKKTAFESQISSGAAGKKGGSISDLHHFIKAFEKDFSAQKGPATPKQILRKVEDQMRTYGLDPKSGNNQATAQALALKYAAQHSAATDQQAASSSGDEQHQPSQQQKRNRKKSLPPKLKLMGLISGGGQQQPQQQLQDSGGAQGFNNTVALFASSNQNVTPSNLSSNGSGSQYPFAMARSQMNINHGSTKKHGSRSGAHPDSGDCWQQQAQHQQQHYGTTRNRSSGSTKNGRKRSHGGQRDRSAESRNSRGKTKSGQLSTGRGASSGSGGRQPQTTNIQLTHAPMVMTERSGVARKPAKSSQERTSYHVKNKSFSKGGGSALAKVSKTALNQIAVKQQLAAQQQHQQQKVKPAKTSQGQHKKGSSVSAMNQIATGRQTDQQLLQQILNGTGGSISVRNSDYNSKLFTTKANNKQGSKGGAMLGGTATQQIQSSSGGGSQTNRQFTGAGTTTNSMSNNILFELIQSQAADSATTATSSKKQQQKQSSLGTAAPVNLTLKQSGSQSSRTPATAAGPPISFNKSGQPIKMIKKTNHE